MREKIHIYHTNDVHSHFEKWPRIRKFLKERKALHEANGEDVFIFDCGDFVDRWHSFTEGTLGKGNVELLNDAGYTAVTLGNNEGLTLPHDVLNHLYDEAEFDVLAANLYLPGGTRPSWALPYQIYKTSKGTKIGVTAATAYYRPLYKLLGWELSEPLSELENQIAELQKQADIIIVLSHLGMHDDQKIAENNPRVDLILGGHTHHVFMNGKKVNHTTLCAAGRYGEYIGYIEGEVDTKNFNASLFETAVLDSPPNAAEYIKDLDEIGKDLLQTEVVTLPEPLDYSWLEQSDLPAILCEALYKWCKADCALINSGLILSALEKGVVTKYDLHRMLPHPINPCVVELSGAELQEVLVKAEESGLSELEFQGLGFRGVMMGKFVYHDIEYGKDGRSIKIAGAPLVREKIYHLATLDMFTFGVFLPPIKNARSKIYYLPEFVRDLMEWELKQRYK
ncbi:bifunctional UDP-sugar hydrolase/5'-nucleotidase [Siminovitchia fortis]|uniref:Bifunctional metallophosphatase/5'-nucleotidase n=1 Tax=Siminovitchia fortis TaxID=254758 RepID=A0A443IMR1_9BACI|nr:bifunctional UDP-sugar hydrolase/5'-nucleotidase [Siminovitchia fortis]RWR06964.1 bifunctional metallophosphatase/5'-nucleotidase [Siminovitchia fortis]WHY82124.1 bifunctional UDP-sugar hydrolase/5'-nucleotidase [Siminovitchia fortis]